MAVGRISLLFIYCATILLGIYSYPKSVLKILKQRLLKYGRRANTKVKKYIMIKIMTI